MGRFSDELRLRTRSFFTNWREFDASRSTKLRLTLRNRWQAIVLLEGCCGHPGQPGC